MKSDEEIARDHDYHVDENIRRPPTAFMALNREISRSLEEVCEFMPTEQIWGRSNGPSMPISINFASPGNREKQKNYLKNLEAAGPIVSEETEKWRQLLERKDEHKKNREKLNKASWITRNSKTLTMLILVALVLIFFLVIIFSQS